MKRAYLAIAVVSLVLSPRMCLAADSPVTDDWYLFIDDQLAYGSEHVVRRTLDGGHLEYQIETRVLIDFLGARQEESTSATYVVTSDLQPISLSVVTQRSSGRVELTGSVEDAKFILHRESNGLRRSSAIDLGRRPIFRALLPEALSRTGAQPDGTVRTLAVMGGEFLSVESAKCQAMKGDDPSTTAWSIEIGSDDVLSKGLLTLKDGIREHEEFSIPRYNVRRGTRLEAEKIAYRRLDGRDALMFDVDQPIARLDQLEELTVRLRWKGVSLDRLHLSDSRQIVVSHKTEGDQHEAVVRIAHPDASAARKVETPRKGIRDELTGKSRFIDPTDPDIVSTAREWTKDCETPRDAVAALAEHVYQHLEGGELIAETLSGPEVLKCRKGKCSEYSVLFASLARSQGIPTRIVLGDRMIGGQWIGHMWNEVFLEVDDPDRGSGQTAGRWVTVDSTTKEVGSAPALLKFTHSATVYGTQPIRWGLTDSLELSVKDFALKSERAPDAWKTGVVGNTYTSAEFGFQISVPNADWKIAPDLKAGQLILRLHVPERDRVLIHCVAYSLPVAIDAKTAMTMRNARFIASYKDYEVFANEAVSIGERDWQTLQFTHARGAQSAMQAASPGRIKTTEYAFHQGNVGYLVNLISGESAHDEVFDQFQEIMKSVAFKSADMDR